MNKAELIEKVAKDTKLSKAKANAAIDAVLNNTVSTLKKGGKVVLVGFGTFQVNKRQARKGRNPQNGKVINIPARKVVKFKAGKGFASKVK